MMYGGGGDGSYGDEFDQSLSAADSEAACSQGHRSGLNLRTVEGGSICLICFSNLISNANSPTVHVSYAISQLSVAVSHRLFLEKLVRFHSHLLVSPLVQALAAFDDERILDQVVELVVEVCRSAEGGLVCGDFVTRISDFFCSGCLAWSKRQAYMLHCFGILLNIVDGNPLSCIKDVKGFLSYLVEGLQMPSEEIRGEIMFVMYKLVQCHYESVDHDFDDDFYGHCPRLLHVSLDALMKTQSDDVRLNCIALLGIFAHSGAFEDSFVNDVNRLNIYESDSFMKTVEGTQNLNILFAEAVKGPMLSSDSQVQIGTLELIFHLLSWKGNSTRQIQELVEESIADYVFEALRLSEKHDTVITLCLKVLDMLSKADQAFSQRLPIGFSTLLSVLRQVAGVPFHPVQSHALKLIMRCVSDCPGVVSIPHVEELGLLLTNLFERHTEGDMGMLPETFNLACSLFVALLSAPASIGIMNLVTLLKRATENAVLSCLSSSENPTQLLFSLYLLKEAHSYSQQGNPTNPCFSELSKCILDICKMHLLPWIVKKVYDIESEEVIMGVLETFHALILLGSGSEGIEFAATMVSSSWFSFSFECLGLYPTESMRVRVFMLVSLLVDALLGDGSGSCIKVAALQLPSDPRELLAILGQKACNNHQLSTSQNAALRILYVSSLYDERLADEKLVIAALEQYILVNSDDLLRSKEDPLKTTQLVSLYGLYRGLGKSSYQIPYSPEAERILFQIISGPDWDLLSARVHPTALKWLFQKDKIFEPLSLQVLKFCRKSSLNSTVALHNDCEKKLVHAFAQLVEDGDNYVALSVVCILKQLLVSEGCTQDIMSIMHMMLAILNVCPCASNSFCSHGIGSALQNLYNHANLVSFLPLALHLVFNILSCLQPEELSDDDDAWLPLTVKLMDNMSRILNLNKCSYECAITIGILCLIIHHSTNGVLTEAAKIILLNTSWISAIKKLIDASCSAVHTFGSSQIDCGFVETLPLVLLLQGFSLKSLPVVLPGYLNWQHLLYSSVNQQAQSVLSCHCNELCRLLYFGSPTVKLVASNCLLELFTRVSEEISDSNSLKFPGESLMAVMAILEGLISCSNAYVAMNCALCLAFILQWTQMDLKETTRSNMWCRFIVEELAMSLATPCLASKSFTEQHKPAAHVAAALFNLKSVPEWMKSVFDETCISGILLNLSPGNVSREIVILLRQLLISGYLKPDHIAPIEKVLQACRKQLYSSNAENGEVKDYSTRLLDSMDDWYKVCDILIHLMSSESSEHGAKPQRAANSKLVEAIDMFFISLTEKGIHQGVPQT